MNKLGKTQLDILKVLSEDRTGRYYPGCGWIWGNHSETVRILESLVKRGMIIKESRPVKNQHGEYSTYRLFHP